MLEFFSVIFIISLVLSIVFWRKFNKTKDPNVRKKAIYSSIPLAISFIIIGANADEIEQPDDKVKVSAESKEDESKEKPKTETKEKPKAEPKTPEERITSFINKEIGKKTNTKKTRIVSVGYVADTLEILMNADESLTPNSTRKSILINAKEVFEELKGYEDVTGDIIVGYYLDLVDQFGNVEPGKVLSIRLTQEILDQINFKNFNSENFEKISDVYYLHPAIGK